MRRLASSLSMPGAIKSLVQNGGTSSQSNKKEGESPAGEEDPQITKLKKKAQLSKDARTLNKKQFEEKYGKLSKEDRKSLDIPESYSTKDISDVFKDYDDDFYTQKISSTEKGIKQKQERQAQEETQRKEREVKEQAERKEYEGTMSGLDQRRKAIQEKYGYNPDEKFKPVDYHQEYVKGVTSEAERRIKEKNPVRLKGYDPKDTDQMTCAKGVCTLAANQGVDFSKFEGNFEIDEQGRKIPVQNASFREKLATTGYEEIPYSQRKPGDIASFQFGGKNAPSHMEMVLGASGNMTRFFNNYELANEPNAPESGTSQRLIMPTPEGPGRNLSEDENVQNAFVYRLKPEVAKQAYLKKNPEYAKKLESWEKLQAAPEYQEYQQSLSKADDLKKKYPQYASTAKK